MTDQTHFTPLNSTLTELGTARGTLLQELAQLTRFMRAITTRLPRSARLRRDIGLSEEHTSYDTRNEVANIAARFGMPL